MRATIKTESLPLGFSPDARRLRRAAALLAALALAAPAAVAAAASPSDAPIDTPGRTYVRVVARPDLRVGMTVTVTDERGDPVRNLDRGDFRVTEDGAPVEIVEFGVEGERRDRPLSVAVLLDLSQSMRAQVRKVREAAGALLATVRPGDEIMVAKFNDQLTILQGFTSDPREANANLGEIGQAWGGTALFRAIEETLKDLRGRPGRKVILVVSDGLDNLVDREQHVLQSLYLSDLLRLSFRSQTVVYGIRPGMGATSWLPFEGFVQETGGRLLYTGGDLERLFTRLGEEFRSQYYLAYDADPARRGRRRRIRVEVARPGVVVRALGGWEGSRARLATLLRSIAADDEETRADAAYDLGFIPDPRARRALLEALADADPKVRRLAAGGLGRLEAGEAAPALILRLDDTDAAVRDAAAQALRLFGPGAIELLAGRVREGAAGTPDPGTRHAVALLGILGDERAVAPLAAALGAPAAESRRAAAAALGDLGLSAGVPALRAALADEDREVRKAAARSIVRIAGRAARAVIERYLEREPDAALREEIRALLPAPGPS